MRRVLMTGVAAALFVACGGETQVATDGSSGTTSASSSSSASSTSAGSGGNGATSSSSSVGGGGGSGGSTGGAPPACLEQTAEACMVVANVEKPREHTTLTVQASRFIGGIDRWVFDFTWLYDDPMTDDEEESIELPVRIMRLGPMYEPNTTPVTWSYPMDAGMPLEILNGTYRILGFAMQSYDVVAVSGTLTIRQANGQFEGSLAFILGDAQTPSTPSAEVAGPFSVSVPP